MGLKADNLAMDSILGFMQSSNASFSCRLCNAHKDLIQKMVKENEKLLRSANEYVKQAAAQTEGVVELCVFADLPYYDPIDCAMSDGMHDWDEGIDRYVLGFCLNAFIYNKSRMSI